ncbi:DUF982 domain-containing protein [Mesorhizobium sp. CO1-1-7]|uniref:DUF982 domain-containing protein n=1 Tax=unclassified Mesorhizobium TaxID=325217 RepID=UPI0011296226|nr:MULTISPECIES: DUF982 domain-containing protein [unclassified Mesorhizobium]MBZ9748368.1 DUF982 domain-containing protein [Mesorhizobium sp. CO1-1-7]TPL99352.1 DUF982 domain-containing protein [Mesorhizobium sp. B2-3-10]
MTPKRFTRPVQVIVGLGFAHEVSSVMDAYQLLDEWVGFRSPTHAATLALFRSALADDEDAETARLAFEAFARSRGILAAEEIVSSGGAAEEWMTAYDRRSEVVVDG